MFHHLLRASRKFTISFFVISRSRICIRSLRRSEFLTFIISGRAQKHIDIKITRVIICSLITAAILFHDGLAHGLAIALNFSWKSTGSRRKSRVIFRPRSLPIWFQRDDEKENSEKEERRKIQPR